MSETRGSASLLQRDTLAQLTQSFLKNHPHSAARVIEQLPPEEAADLVRSEPASVSAGIWNALSPSVSTSLLETLSIEEAVVELGALSPHVASGLLSRLEPELAEKIVELLPGALASDVRELLEYPPNSVGRIMNTRATIVDSSGTVDEAIAQLKRHDDLSATELFVSEGQGVIIGEVPIRKLLYVDGQATLERIMRPLTYWVAPLDSVEDVIKQNEDWQLEFIPVIDVHGRLAGVIESEQFFTSVKEDLVADMQTMVGVSREEKALSSAWFAVRKRLPWLQINLLTAFLAASVVGFFESTIAMYTALAVLLPVAAGQSGNAGAQALAVTMRGLTLREITIGQWLAVTLKEVSVGLINGIAIAITCGIGVYVWSRSVGLALVISLSMVISLVIAGMAGALVPILLKRFGQDPAQSSSIVLTTVTDIAGFMSFLGIATLLSGML